MGLIEGIIESAAENTVKHAVEDKVNETIDKKAKEDTTTGKVAKGAKVARKAKKAYDVAETVNSNRGFIGTILHFLFRW